MSTPTTDKAGVRQVIRALKVGGWTLDYVDDGGEEIAIRNDSETQALDAIMAVDDARLYVRHQDERGSWVRFVLGNAPEEVVCDYTTDLETSVGVLTDGWYGS